MTQRNETKRDEEARKSALIQRISAHLAGVGGRLRPTQEAGLREMRAAELRPLARELERHADVVAVNARVLGAIRAARDARWAAEQRELDRLIPPAFTSWL